MKPIYRGRWSCRLLHCLLSTSLLLLLPGTARGQAPESAQAVTPQATASDRPQSSSTGDSQARFLDSVTVSATLSPVRVRDTPGTVSVIDDETIASRLVENIADLVAFEPGVYIETTANRVGLNGFNIRGIGGNRVVMRVDGVETAEQFDFGPFNVHQFALDLDTLASAEIVRSAGSSLYGSDALGGVVSFFTKNPGDYLSERQRFHIGAKTMFDSRGRDASGNVVVAGGRPRLRTSLFASYAGGHEPRNKGTIETDTVTRTALNPQDRRSAQALAKLVFSAADGNVLRGIVEVADNDVETEAYSLRSAMVAGPATTTVTDITSNDTLRRRRVSLDHSLTGRAGLNLWSWTAFAQQSDVGQVVDEVRVTTGGGPALTVLRSGTLEYAQDSYGGTLQGRKAFATGPGPVLLTFGGGHTQHVFDMLRDRVDVNAASGAIIPATNLILPSKYFPRSEVAESGVYVQGEMRVGRLTLVPGVRFDRFSLDADEDDDVYIASLSPAAADFHAGALSARVGAAVALSSALTLQAQYAGGFRAPPYSAVNSGFTNLLGGYTSIPNTDLDAETSDNVEIGFRSAAGPLSIGVTAFWNAYDDFILQVQRGFNPATRLLEFQYQNVSKVNIRGVEMQGEARLARGLRLRASYAVIRGDDVSGEEDVPLNSIAPDQGVVGLQYTAPSNRWGTDLQLRASHGQSAETAGDGYFVPEAYGVLDVFGWTDLGRGISLRAGVHNLTDRRYFEWPNVRGRQAGDPAIDRYSSPGASVLASLSYGW